jgi:hypothetical protein
VYRRRACGTYNGAPDCAVADHARRGFVFGAVVSLAVLLTPLAALAESAPAPHGDPAAALVLSASDVGPGYHANTAVSGIRTLSEVSYGDTQTIVRYLDADWLGGTESAFNGLSTGIISVADVFRPGAPVDTVLRAWQDDAQAITGGDRVPLPHNYPGGDPVLISGTVVDYGILIYMWREGRVIATLEVTGKPAKLQRSMLIELARRQEARISRATSTLPTRPFK